MQFTHAQITGAEYFWDTDPGQGNATAITAEDGALDEVLEELIATGIASSGLGTHIFNVRVKDADEVWGPVFSSIVVNEEVIASLSVTVTQAEYFWNTDPGAGAGGAILAVDGNLNQALEQLFANEIPLVKEGLNTFNIRVKNSENTWGPVFTSVINVESTLILDVEEDQLLVNTSVLSPNPAIDIVNIDISNEYIGKIDITIIDMTGKVVYATSYTKSNMVFSQPLDISSLAKGLYQVQLTIDNKQAIKKLIK
ncbi:hypothetical protein GCM10022393_02660 [Aquimarina addita]|uniref:Secretion system C-terminal sorting domain-containing protein n=1 Tax=Aquimarina addita TaxID=870485 RepID=A0ABP7X8L2_9FLAO